MRIVYCNQGRDTKDCIESGRNFHTFVAFTEDHIIKVEKIIPKQSVQLNTTDKERIIRITN